MKNKSTIQTLTPYEPRNNMGGGKLVKLLLAVCLLILSSPKQSFTQDLIPGVLIVNALTENAKPSEDRMIENETLLTLFQQYGVTSYAQTMPFARTPSLHNVYRIEFTGNQQNFINVLEQNYATYFNGIEELYEAVELYDPVDDFWGEGKLWHLEKIQADSAWDITRSSDSIDITVLDQVYPDIGHPDLVAKINPPYDPWDNHDFPDGASYMFHASEVCCFAAGETTETGNTAQGKLAASGFNSNLIYTKYDGEFLPQMVFVSTVLGTEVISISIHTGYHQEDTDTLVLARWRASFNEIFENGTVVVVSAGNLPDSGAPRVINGYVDERIIMVSGTDSTDHFGVDDGQGGTTHFSHYSAVDLCAPGYRMPGPAPVTIDSITPSGDTILIPNPNPYNLYLSGTSYSAPITAGVAALIKSINPCLAPEDVQYILKSTTDPIVDRLQYPGTIGTGRLNAYKAVKLAHDSYNFTSYTIHNGEDLTWTEPHFIDTLYIEPGGKLTINADCFFNAGGLAIIDTLAKLTVNNSTLTTTCRNLWYGIHVWGKKAASQFPDNGNYIQGRLILNGATIKNAHEAVSLWKDGDFNSSGGYVIANNTSFINNRRAVAFMSYHNYHPVTLYPERNFSNFEDCDFILDEHYLNEVPFHGFVSLWEVEGVQFEGCRFANDRDSIYSTGGVLNNDSLSGFGLWAVDAGFKVTSYINGQQVDSSRFEKLEYGIHAMSANGTSRASKGNIFIDESLFDQNITGIYTSAIYGPSIVHNSFFVNPIDTATSTVFGGVYFDNYTTGFIIEENHFADHNVNWPWGQTKKSIGLCVNNSGSSNNMVYNNKFEELYIAILAQNNNRSRDVGGAYGLEIKCNELFNNQFDIAVTADNPTDPTAGIKGMQGSDGNNINDPAGNIFSPITDITVEAWDIYTEVYPNKYIDYWYHANQNGYDLRPDSITQFIVRLHPNTQADPYNKTLSCPSNYPSGGGEGTGALKNMVNNMDFKTDSISDLLALMVDGGDTDGTTSDVETAWPDETMEIRADLLSKSPYLSDTVMVTTVLQEEVLPAAIVTEVLVANPQSAKSDKVLDEVYAREDITDNQIDQIEANEMLTGAKESLEIKKSNYGAQRDYALNRLITTYRSDTSIVNPADSIITFLNTQDYVWAKYQLAFEYLATGDLQMAQDTLEAIPDNYDLDAAALNEQAQLEDYFDVVVTLAQSGSNIFQMTAAQKSDLYTIYQNSDGRAGALAKNILQTADTLTYKENYILPTSGAKTGKVRRHRAARTFENDKLKVYPNPTRDYVIVEYQLSGETEKVVIKLIDNNGFIRKTILQENNQGFVVIDTRGLETGTYIAHIATNGKLLGVAKFVIIN